VAHLDEEDLVLIALGERPAAAHLDDCDECRAEVEALRAVAELGAETQEVRDLPTPSGAVWSQIAAATGVQQSTVDVPRPGRNQRAVRRGSSGTARRGASPAGGQSRARRWAVLVATAVVAVAVGVAGTLAATRREDPAPRAECGTVVARADLAALPLAPAGATGEARVLCDGADRRLHLHVAGLALQPGYYEVWLIDPATMEMTAIGQLGDGGDVLLPLASTTDLRKFRLVDVSAEQYDNNQAHSGQSLLRGQLTT
jgi:anti-sigma-K factor RskA